MLFKSQTRFFEAKNRCHDSFHTFSIRRDFCAENQLIDQVVLSVHRAPTSYTGEDLVEISCHGGTLVSAKVLGSLSACRGHSSASRGIYRARISQWQNGSTQAEAVIDLIARELIWRCVRPPNNSKADSAIKSGTIRDELIALLAHINASIDFPEEGIEPDEDKTLCARLDSIRDEIAALLATADQGRVLAKACAS